MRANILYVDKNLLIRAVKELQAVCVFKPPMKTENKTRSDLIDLLLEGYDVLEPEDELSHTTQYIFKKIFKQK